MTYAVQDVIDRIPRPPGKPLAAPEYRPLNQYRDEMGTRPKVALAVESMKQHTTDEGFQVMLALKEAGYLVVGRGCVDLDEVHVPTILQRTGPSTVVVQDKLEWDPPFRDFRDQSARFVSPEILATRPDVFRVIIKKDAQNRQDYNRQAADEVGAHGWIVYYHPRIVCHMATYIRPEHVVRTYHSLDPAVVPPFNPHRPQQAILSGAMSRSYPLRERIRDNLQNFDGLVYYLNHPGYHRNGTATPDYLRILSLFKVAICTSSMYGYALRKIVEATACGCRVLTDLPEDEVLPEIDGNLFRVHNDCTAHHVGVYVKQLLREYDPDLQREYAERAKAWYDYRKVGQRLADDIETLRRNYNGIIQ